MDSRDHLPLIREVLATGPNDAKYLLQYAETNSMWETLYLASRNSVHATIWREMFGEHRLSQTYPRSILELAISVLLGEADSGRGSISADSMFMVKLIANCCIDNVPNKKMVIQARGLLTLMKLLANGVDPNILVPTIFNVCADYEDLSEDEDLDSTIADGPVKVNLAEETLARMDLPSSSIYTGLLVLISPHVVLGCKPETLEYLSELIQMSSRLATAPQRDSGDGANLNREFAIERLLANNGAEILAANSAKCRIDILQTLLAISSSESVKEYLASSGTILSFAMMADYDITKLNYTADEEEGETLSKMQALMLKVAYDVCQVPQFINPPKYGTARQSLDIVCSKHSRSPFARAVAFVVLYGFIDSDPRAYILAKEGLTALVSETLAQESDKTVIHPALGVGIKLALTWSLRSQLSQHGAMEAVQHLLTSPNLGYEIPLSAVTLLRLIIKGHPNHIITLVRGWSNASIMKDIFNLFDKDHEAICLEVGLLIIELYSTLGFEIHSAPDTTRFGLDSIVGGFEAQLWSRVLIFTATKGQTVNAIIAQRVWLALALLSRTPNGKKVVLLVLQDPAVVKSIEELKAQAVPGVVENIDFMLHHVRDQLIEASLDVVMNRMSLD